jgi:ribonucleotide monophosphatase NagD (HAD superfamily)
MPRLFLSLTALRAVCAGALLRAGVVEREPIVTGKPSPFLLSDITAHHACSPASMVIVGDRLDTDIAWGRTTGCETLLVMTGAAGALGPADTRHAFGGRCARCQPGH